MSVSKLIADMKEAGASFVQEATPQEKAELTEALDSLRQQTEGPLELALRLLFTPYHTAAFRVAIDMKLFDHAAASEKGEISLEQLSSKAGSDPLLTRRIMRIITGLGFFNETGVDQFVLTPIGAAFANPSPLVQAVIHLGRNSEAASKIPSYLLKTGYRNPGDAYDGVFQYAMHHKGLYWDYLKEHPAEQAAFNVTMELSRAFRGFEWFDVYPVQERVQDVTDSTTLLVDIGGNAGLDVIAFKKKFPELKGKLIIEDLPVVIEIIKDLPEGIEAVAYDFFTPQPFEGAKFYYMRQILHDWPDKQAKLILENIVKAMNKDSVLLLHEASLDETGVKLFTASADLSMMAMLSGMERTAKHWEELLGSVGLQLVKIWKPEVWTPSALGSVFEAVLKA